MRLIISVTLLVQTYHGSAEIFFKEQFTDSSWRDRWTTSTVWRQEVMGEWDWTPGKHTGDHNDKAIRTAQDNRYYGISAPLMKPYKSIKDKGLVIQYSVKFERGIDCAGAYIKLLPQSTDAPEEFGNSSDYAVMFGPDVCGGNAKTHVILKSSTRGGEHVEIQQKLGCKGDELSHVYTLHLKSDNTFEILVDYISVRSGRLQEAFAFMDESELVPDPEKLKPVDWVDEPTIPDPRDKKPPNFDDYPPRFMPNPKASKPKDWNDDANGVWEHPLIENHEWEPWEPIHMINPDYIGPWVQPMIKNPKYVYDDRMFNVCSVNCTRIGFELWQVRAGVVFDDIIVTDDLEEAKRFAEETFFAMRDVEMEAYASYMAEVKKQRKEKRERDYEDDRIDHEDQATYTSIQNDDILHDEF